MGGMILFIVKPIYFKDDHGNTVKRIFVVSNDQDNASYAVCIDSGSMMEKLTKHFHDRGIDLANWQLTVPQIRGVDSDHDIRGLAVIVV